MEKLQQELVVAQIYINGINMNQPIALTLLLLMMDLRYMTYAPTTKKIIGRMERITMMELTII